MTGKRFLIWLGERAESLRPGNVVICDNLSAHEVSGVDENLAAVGDSLCCLPPYRPGFNPVEKDIAEMKSFSKKWRREPGTACSPPSQK